MRTHRCGQCKHFKKDTRKAYQRKTFSWGWCEYPVCPLPKWAWFEDDEPNRTTSHWEIECATFEAKP